MRNLVCGYDLGPKICKALGLNAISIKSLSIRIPDACDPVFVDVTYFLDSSQAKELNEVLKSYSLVENSPPSLD